MSRRSSSDIMRMPSGIKAASFSACKCHRHELSNAGKNAKQPIKTLQLKLTELPTLNLPVFCSAGAPVV